MTISFPALPNVPVRLTLQAGPPTLDDPNLQVDLLTCGSTLERLTQLGLVSGPDSAGLVHLAGMQQLNGQVDQRGLAVLLVDMARALAERAGEDCQLQVSHTVEAFNWQKYEDLQKGTRDSLARELQHALAKAGRYACGPAVETVELVPAGTEHGVFGDGVRVTLTVPLLPEA